MGVLNGILEVCTSACSGTNPVGWVTCHPRVTGKPDPCVMNVRNENVRNKLRTLRSP